MIDILVMFRALFEFVVIIGMGLAMAVVLVAVPIGTYYAIKAMRGAK